MLLFLFATIFILTWLSCFFYRSFANRYGLLDHPDVRSAHVEPTPTGAGIVLVLWFYIGFAFLWYMGLVHTHIFMSSLAGLPVGLVGFIDDVKKLRWEIRASIHGVCAGWCIYWIDFPVIELFGFLVEPNLITSIFGAIALLWLINLYNFMDGIDGLAASEAIFVCAAGILLVEIQGNDWYIFNLLLASVSVGFLMLNWPPARLFMGDAGSGFLGLMLGLIILSHHDVSVWSWIILSGYFFTDACLTIVIRLLRGEKIYNAHSQHAYQHMTRTIGDKKTLYSIIAINIFWLLPIALFVQFFSEYGPLLVLLSYLPLLLVQFLCGAGQNKPRLTSLEN